MSEGFEGLWPGNGPSTGHRRAAPDEDLDKATEERLLDAAERVVERVGVARLSMSDVARSAGVARGTLYRYFESREVLLDALRRRTTYNFFDTAAEAMDGLTSLSDQLCAFSRTMVRSIHPEPDGVPSSQAAMIHMLATQSTQALRRTSKFLQPYVESARLRGEVAGDLDVDDASEWLARVLLSFTVFQASTSFAPDDPQSVSEFVQRYAINGLTGAPPRPEREEDGR